MFKLRSNQCCSTVRKMSIINWALWTYQSFVQLDVVKHSTSIVAAAVDSSNNDNVPRPCEHTSDNCFVLRDRMIIKYLNALRSIKSSQFHYLPLRNQLHQWINWFTVFSLREALAWFCILILIKERRLNIVMGSEGCSLIWLLHQTGCN